MEKVGAAQEHLGNKVYESIRNAIISGELVPGSLHSVRSLATALETSRTPVREALVKLADQGMVAFERNHGTRILQMTVQDLEEMFSLRLLLEVPAAHRAALRAEPHDLEAMRTLLAEMRRLTDSKTASPKQHLVPDAKFHLTILEAAGNKRMTDFVRKLFDLRMVRDVSIWGVQRDAEAIFADHKRIFDCIAARDSDGAARAMRDHISISAGIIMARQSGNGADAAHFRLPYMDVLTLFGR
jgi:DNA-binding GntR family transcriptional regulator